MILLSFAYHKKRAKQKRISDFISEEVHSGVPQKQAVAKAKSKKFAETYSPPQAVRSEAQRALEWIKDGQAGGGFTAVGRARAAQLANGQSVSVETLRRMHSFLSRHSVDSQGKGYSPKEQGYPSAGRVAYAAWGGKPALPWVRGILSKIDKSSN